VLAKRPISALIHMFFIEQYIPNTREETPNPINPIVLVRG
jgi:hypothetical protein